MTLRTTGEGDTARPAQSRHDNVACPFCGILCDDLAIERAGGSLKVTANGCDKAKAGFERAMAAAKPQIAGKDATLQQAVAAAAGLIRAANQPLFGGLGTDVDGMRAVMALADRAGGVVDHALSEGQYRNFRVMQTTGWVMTTLTETRNRADLVIIAGSDVHKLHPRFFERVVAAPHSMFGEGAKRTVVFVGAGLDTSAAKGGRIGDVVTLPCPLPQVGQVFAALRAHLAGKPVSGDTIAGLPAAAIADLAERCRKADYGVVVWAPPSLDYPNADLTVQQISDMVKEINKTKRFAGLSLGGNEGAVSAGAVCAWQSGFPLRVSYASGKPLHDPERYAINRLLASGEGDVLTWVATFTPDLKPPATKVPTILIATPGVQTAAPPAVYIPVGTPGADHAGRIVRCDNVVSLPLRDLGRSSLPRAADVLAMIEQAL